MDKASIRLEITCSQLVKDYYGKQSALTKCNFLLPLSAKNPSDFSPSVGKSINYICSWSYANVASTPSKQEQVPGRGKGQKGTPCFIDPAEGRKTSLRFEGILVTLRSPEARQKVESGRRGPAAVRAVATANKGSPPSLGLGVLPRLPPLFQSDPYEERHCPHTHSPCLMIHSSTSLASVWSDYTARS